MASERSGESLPNKRRKLIDDVNCDASINVITTTDVGNLGLPSGVAQTTVPRGLDRPITPPPSKRIKSETPKPHPTQTQHEKDTSLLPTAAGTVNAAECEYINSPIQLTRIKDLSNVENVDTVGLGDILGDPMIRECWNFNFLFDIDFVMKHFDPDVRNLVQLKIVHGFWKNEDERRIQLVEATGRYSNIELLKAFLPDPFGTHHSKMLILLRHDDHAQVIIHTANMISRDWTNMAQAVWRSPLLPLRTPANDPSGDDDPPVSAIGSGERFKIDLLRYLDGYGKRLTDLTTQLKNYDFAAIRAAFIGSRPSRQKIRFAAPSSQTSWGWLGLREILSTVPVESSAPEDTKAAPHIVIQISSIATLGGIPTWLTHFQSVLSKHSTPNGSPTSATTGPSTTSAGANFFTKRSPNHRKEAPPKFSIIFPTPHEIRTSLDGYDSGASIHTKIQSAAQQKQLEYLRPIFCHWKHHSDAAPSPDRKKAGRGLAAPHIKTYIRFHDDRKESIDWAMVTSANLSKQAWGDVENKNGEIWIQSYECGVVVWPALFEADKMVPVFGKDMPEKEDVGRAKVVGFRMPYDLPLERYTDGEVPWCASAEHNQPDWKGQVWGGYQPH